MAQDLIADQDTGKNVAIMRGGEVFRDDREGARVAIVLNDYLYDLNGVLVGPLKGRHVIDANTRSTPIGFRKLLEGRALRGELGRHKGETAVTEDLQDRNARLRGKIEQLGDNHPELEAVVNDVALKQPTTASLEKVQANLQERARAIVEAKPELEGYFED